MLHWVTKLPEPCPGVKNFSFEKGVGKGVSSATHMQSPGDATWCSCQSWWSLKKQVQGDRTPGSPRLPRLEGGAWGWPVPWGLLLAERDEQQQRPGIRL